MKIHTIRIIDDIGHQSTQRLFELGLSFGTCKQLRKWPSLYTMNTFLKAGVDEGELGTTIEWEPCELTSEEYQKALTGFMRNETYDIDETDENWEDWFARVSTKQDA